MYEKKLSHNIPKDYIFTFLSRFDLTHGVWVLYLASRGLSLFHIGLMETIYHISSFTLEIPTGAVADIYGRKVSRILGRLAAIISAIIMIYGYSTYHFAISFFFVALGNNLESGAGDALIYDSLIEIKSENKYSKIRGRNEVVYQLTRTLSLILGGYIATISFTNVYITTVIISSLSFIQAFTFREPTIGKVEKSHNFLSTFKKQLITSISVIKEDKRIVKIILAIELFETFYTTEFFYLQNHFKNLGYSELVIGIVLSAGALVTAFLASKTYKLEQRFKLKKILTYLPILAIVNFWLMTFPGLEICAFILLSGIEGILFVTVGDYINRLVPSGQRATILSFQSMVFSIYMIILFPTIGKIGDIFSLSSAFRVIAIISTVSLSLMIYLVKKINFRK